MNENTTEKKKAGVFLKILAAVLAGIVFGLAVELVCQLPLLLLKESEKGVCPLSREMLQKDDGFIEKDGKLEKKDGQTAELSFDLQGRYVDKLCYSYEVLGCVNATVYVEKENLWGDFETVEFRDTNSACIATSVMNIGAKVRQVRLVFDPDYLPPREGEVLITQAFLGEPLRVTQVFVSNQVVFRPLRFALCAVLFALLLLAFFFRAGVSRHPEAAFAAAALPLGMIILALLPPIHVSWDEIMHFEKAYAWSVYPRTEENNVVIFSHCQTGIMTWRYNYPASAEELAEMEEYLDVNYANPEWNVPLDFYTDYKTAAGYLGSGLFVKAARRLGLSHTLIFQAGRLFNLLFYVFFMVLCIHFLPVGKYILAAMGLMPTLLFQACSYSYDNAITIGGFLLMTLVARSRVLCPDDEEKPRPISFAVGVVVLLFAAVLLLCKAVYAPLLLLVLLIPKESLRKPWQVYVLQSMAVILTALLFASFLLPAAAGVEMGDFRGGDTSTVGQLSYLLANPLGYARILMNAIWEALPDFLVGPSALGLMGYLKDMQPGTYAAWLPVIMAFVIVTDTYGSEEMLPEKGITPLFRLGVFLICGACVALIFTSMYLAYTEVQSLVIAGVQGRYMIPLFLPLYLILQPPFLKNRMKEEWYAFAVFALMLLVSAVNLTEMLLLPFGV